MSKSLKFSMRNQNIKKQSGFTIIELLVVCAIMAIVATIGIINWNSERSARTLTIAQNELITNIRKVQSYAVSSRNTPAGEAAKYYVIEVSQNATTLPVSAVVGPNNSLSAVETINLPTDVTISALSVAGQSSGYVAPSGSGSCVDIVFSVTYGKTYFVVCDALGDALMSFPVLAPLSNFNLSLNVTHKGVSKGVNIYGLNGKVEASTPFDPATVEKEQQQLREKAGIK